MTDAIARLTTALAERYTIERELGAGGMATVYLAHDVRHDRKVALKVLRPELAAILGGGRFLAEIKTTANLQHPHILSLFDSGEAEGLVYYVMPYVEGESLRDRLTREKQLPVEDAVRIAREVADALHYAHGHGIVHRDIKPENILLHGGHAMVADFGIALAASKSEGGTRMTETGMSLGTPHYMSPEQAMGEKEITPRADIYALGCVTYEMLTAEPPFVGATAQAIIARVMTEQPRSLTLQRRTIPPHVEAAVQKALEKLPADRFASAAQFAEALSRTDFAMPAPRAAPAARAPARRLATLLPWVLLAASVAAGAWGWLRPQPRPVSRALTTLWTLAVAPGVPSRLLAISPDGRTIVFGDTVAGVFQLWSKERDRLEATPLSGTNGAGVWSPVFSPDGEWIAFIADGKIRKVPRLGGSAIVIADSANMNYPAVAWLDNGTIAFNDGSYALKIVGEDGGPVMRVYRADSTRGLLVTSITPLPGGHGVLAGVCSAGCTAADLRALDLRTGQWHTLSEQVIKGWHTRDGEVVFVRQDGGVFAAPFDLGKLAFAGPPVPVLNGVRTTSGRADLVLGADGTLLYVAGAAQSEGTPHEPVWVTRQGAATAITPGWSIVPSANPGLALSPDGRRLAVSVRASGSTDIWIKDLPLGPFTRLTFGPNSIRPEWTADGRTVLYVSNKGGDQNEDLRARSSDGTGEERTLLDARRTIFEVVRTRDTSQLIVRYGTPATRDIYLWRRPDSAAAPLLAADGYEEVAPALSPDGRWLAYASNESGRYEVYVRPFPRVDDGRWQVSRNGGSVPLWSHRGDELLYIEAGGGLVAVKVAPGASFVAGSQQTLFPARVFLENTTHRVYDISRDDRQFVFLRGLGGPQGTGPQPVVRVDNWLEELRARPRRR